ncbi:peptidase [Marivirga sp. S37H4]|uniref:Peptidase n=1 Tax=Marivirga aurantiaca TaxID=2802615 RepID=A0A935C8L4_9BACT|nr:peptidase [Marivirga aurantiaca]MBK6265676.1 peptidase [Marivirga aurantiaca]
MLKRTILLISLLCTIHSLSAQDLNYTVNLNDREGDTFKVSLEIDRKLSEENNIYQFAATAPGTYQIMDMGRFVQNFKALDKKGREIETKQLSTNQFQIVETKKVKKVKTITYEIAETWDTKVEENTIYKMCGSSIEDDHVLINGQTVFGYFSGMQAEPMSIQLQYPAEWKVGTALVPNEEGLYIADNYDHIVDSPILLGRLTKANTSLGGTNIDVYTYSKTDMIASDDLLGAMEEMLKAADDFVVEFPVDRYTFLFHFEDETWGAWEHSYSSEYIYAEQPWSPQMAASITSTAAHEFFHIITPLNIHSEIIEQFNFIEPTASEHLWMYEGVTEWASDLMQLRAGMIDLEQFFKELQQKLYVDARYDSTYSLSKLSLTSYTPEGQKQYGNIYMRGALVAGLLDIRLLELSNGERGLREVVNELSKKYGPDNAFPEADFFDIFVEMTYPEIAEFFDKYVKNANPLPIKEYYNKLGINYERLEKTGDMVPSLGYGLTVADGNIIIIEPSDSLATIGVKVNDILHKVNGNEVSLQNARMVLGTLSQQPVGYEYELTVLRGEEEINFASRIIAKEEVKEHIFTVNEKSASEAAKLRDAWMKNL